jgi:hypothetical protein
LSDSTDAPENGERSARESNACGSERPADQNSAQSDDERTGRESDLSRRISDPTCNDRQTNEKPDDG